MLPFLVQLLREFAALMKDEPVDVVLENLAPIMKKSIPHQREYKINK